MIALAACEYRDALGALLLAALPAAAPAAATASCPSFNRLRATPGLPAAALIAARWAQWHGRKPERLHALDNLPRISASAASHALKAHLLHERVIVDRLV